MIISNIFTNNLDMISGLTYRNAYKEEDALQRLMILSDN